jgi:hypothetical protein
MELTGQRVGEHAEHGSDHALPGRAKCELQQLAIA